MFLAAITGGIGSGKSLLSSMMRKKGFLVLDLDEIVSRLYQREEIASRVERAFGSLDRKKIAEQAFSSDEKRKRLESILHPPALAELRRSVRESGKEIVFVEVPLLFESGFQEEFDFVATVSASRENRLKRLEARGMPRSLALRIMDAQASEAERVKKADTVIFNNGTREELEKRALFLAKKVGGFA